MKNTQAIIQKNKEKFVNELIELLKVPTVSADTNFAQDVIKGAEMTAEYLIKAGLDNVEVCKTAGHPIVYGEKIIDVNLPTVLVYGHYDVQPADPIDLSIDNLTHTTSNFPLAERVTNNFVSAFHLQ